MKKYYGACTVLVMMAIVMGTIATSCTSNNTKPSNPKVIESLAKTSISTILKAQKAFYTEENSFTSDFNALDVPIPDEFDEYRLRIIEADASKAIVTATAKKDGLASFSGAVFTDKVDSFVQGVCKSDQFSKQPPDAPRLKALAVNCGSGASVVE